MNQDTKPTSSQSKFASGKLRILRHDLTRLGDAVASVAQPIARAIDRVAGTDIEHCGGCKKRQDALNRVGQSLFASKPTADSGD